jgi:hypothetical protein
MRQEWFNYTYKINKSKRVLFNLILHINFIIHYLDLKFIFLIYINEY